MPLWFFNGISPLGGAFANGNNPAFWLLRIQSVVSSPGVLTNLAETLTDGRSIVDLSAGMALTNILNRLKIGSTHTYNIVEVVGPSLILTAGAYNFVRHFTFIPDMLSSIGSKLAGHLTASVVVSAESGLNDDVCSWVVAQNSGQHARSLILAPPSGQDFEDEESDDGRDGCVQADQAKAPLNYLPSFGTTDFQYNGYRMTLHRTAATVVTDFDGKVTKVQEGEVNKAKNITVTCFTLCAAHSLSRSSSTMFAILRCRLTTTLSRSAVQRGKDQTSVTSTGNLSTAPLVISMGSSCRVPSRTPWFRTLTSTSAGHAVRSTRTEAFLAAEATCSTALPEPTRHQSQSLWHRHTSCHCMC
jgi:hypothetical protein